MTGKTVRSEYYHPSSTAVLAYPDSLLPLIAAAGVQFEGQGLELPEGNVRTQHQGLGLLEKELVRYGVGDLPDSLSP